MFQTLEVELSNCQTLKPRQKVVSNQHRARNKPENHTIPATQRSTSMIYETIASIERRALWKSVDG